MLVYNWNDYVKLNSIELEDFLLHGKVVEMDKQKYSSRLESVNRANLDDCSKL